MAVIVPMTGIMGHDFIIGQLGKNSRPARLKTAYWPAHTSQ
jgi:hypothetical protein